MKRLRQVLIALLPILAGGCRGCFCTNAAHSFGEKPTEEEIIAGARTGVESPSVLKTLCGVRVAGLRDLAVAIVEGNKVRVSGTAIPSDGGTDADAGEDEDDDGDDDAAAPDASVARTPIVTDPTKALVCTGVVIVTSTAILSKDGTRKSWATHVAVDSVQTPGVVFEKDKPKPTPSGGRHRRRHHHH